MEKQNLCVSFVAYQILPIHVFPKKKNKAITEHLCMLSRTLKKFVSCKKKITGFVIDSREKIFLSFSFKYIYLKD